MAFKTPLTPEQAAVMLKVMREQVGAGFNWPGIIRFLLRIVFGADANYRYRFSGDILILILLLSPLALFHPSAGWVLGGIALVYLLAVWLNTPRRRAMRQTFAEQMVSVPAHW